MDHKPACLGQHATCSLRREIFDQHHPLACRDKCIELANQNYSRRVWQTHYLHGGWHWGTGADPSWENEVRAIEERSNP